MGWIPDQKRKSTENSYYYSIEKYRAQASMMPIRILNIRLIRLFLTILPYFFDLQKPGTHSLDPDYFPGSLTHRQAKNHSDKLGYSLLPTIAIGQFLVTNTQVLGELSETKQNHDITFRQSETQTIRQYFIYLSVPKVYGDWKTCLFCLRYV